MAGLYYTSGFVSRLLFLLTVLSVSLAAFAFVLQWRGGLPDPSTRWAPDDDPTEFHGMGGSKPVRLSDSSLSGCENILGQSRMPSFPYFKDWKFNLESSSGSDLKPKVSFYCLYIFMCFLEVFSFSSWWGF